MICFLPLTSSPFSLLWYFEDWWEGRGKRTDASNLIGIVVAASLLPLILWGIYFISWVVGPPCSSRGPRRSLPTTQFQE